MFKQYFKIILRNWKKNKIYTVINIVGLAIAFSITLLISNHVITEYWIHIVLTSAFAGDD